MYESYYPGQPLDPEVIERHAYADGDIRTAQLAAMVLDLREALEMVVERDNAAAEQIFSRADYAQINEALTRAGGA